MKTVIARYTNDQGESLELCKAPKGYDGIVLAVIDDPPPRGTGTEAPMLIDSGTWKWLQDRMRENSHAFLTTSATTGGDK